MRSPMNLTAQLLTKPMAQIWVIRVTKMKPTPMTKKKAQLRTAKLRLKTALLLLMTSKALLRKLRKSSSLTWLYHMTMMVKIQMD